MGLSNPKLVNQFAEQIKPSGHSQNRTLFYEGNMLYSYGKHYPLARIEPEYVFINNSGYSPTTGRHISLVRRNKILQDKTPLLVTTECFNPDKTINFLTLVEVYKKQMLSAKAVGLRARSKWNKNYQFSTIFDTFLQYKIACKLGNIYEETFEKLLGDTYEELKQKLS